MINRFRLTLLLIGAAVYIFFRRPSNLPNTFGLIEYQIATGLPSNTHWIVSADFDNDGKPDIVTISFNNGANFWLRNKFPSFKKLPLLSDQYPGIIHMTTHDVNEDGFMDLVVAYNWGRCFMNCTASDGSIGWLQNPGTEEGWNHTWKLRNIVRKTGTGIHRVRMHKNSATESILIASAMVGAGADFRKQFMDKSAPQILYKRPALQLLLEEKDWEVVRSFDHFHVVHEIYPEEVNGKINLAEGTVTALLSSAERPPFAPRAGWISSLANVQQSLFPTERPFPIPFLATIEPLHGNELVVYHPVENGEFKRHLVERRLFEGSGEASKSPRLKDLLYEQGGHDIVVADIDCDGNPEILALYRGSESINGKGFVIYTANSPLFNSSAVLDSFSTPKSYTPHVLARASFNTLNIADYDGDGINDFALVGWGTAEEDHRVVLFLSKHERCVDYLGRTRKKSVGSKENVYVRNL
ncbi:hypothetical protein BKA69DRAFT_1126927 [Paraphysoderma sedebokerense]|nr:hypothetical protein BKA69DRAFT_1126927 [Paraphysoderma sedebokerense]